jgi:hypothetical protein
MLRLPMGSIGGGGRLAPTTTLSHFLELETEIELLGSGHNVDLTEGRLDALWAQTRRASKSLLSSVLSSVTHRGRVVVVALAIFVPPPFSCRLWNSN